MRRMVVLGAVVLACLCPAAARAYDDPVLGEVASVFAMEPVTVTCATAAVDPFHVFAWGYVDLAFPVVHVDAWLCDSIHDVTDSRFPLSRRALAVMVLTHEAYHARSVWDGRTSEALTVAWRVARAGYQAASVRGRCALAVGGTVSGVRVRGVQGAAAGPPST
jgi:hypothetical protein